MMPRQLWREAAVRSSRQLLFAHQCLLAGLAAEGSVASECACSKRAFIALVTMPCSSVHCSASVESYS